jgi:hypothetical protein
VQATLLFSLLLTSVGQKEIAIIAIFAFYFAIFLDSTKRNFSRFRRTLSLISTVGFAIFTTFDESVRTGWENWVVYAFFEEADCMKLLPLTAAKVTDILAGK